MADGVYLSLFAEYDIILECSQDIVTDIKKARRDSGIRKFRDLQWIKSIFEKMSKIKNAFHRLDFLIKTRLSASHLFNTMDDLKILIENLTHSESSPFVWLYDAAYLVDFLKKNVPKVQRSRNG